MVEWGMWRWRLLWRVGLPHGSVAALSFAVWCVAIATGVRVLLGMISPDMTVFVPYFSAKLIAVLVGGIGAGCLAAGSPRTLCIFFRNGVMIPLCRGR
jgi:hypothetical protein